MQKAQFSKFLGFIATLTPAQMRQVEASLASSRERRDSLNAIEAVRPMACRHCGSSHVVRNGMRSGLQRVLCRDCTKTSNAATGTPLSKLHHKEKFERFALCMKDRLTIRQTAETVGICMDTAFRWRHRFLQNIQSHQPKAVGGLLEVDETYFRESQKGSRDMTRPARKRGGKAKGKGRFGKDWVPVLVGRVRGQSYTVDKVLDRVTGAEVTAALKDAVKAGETIICTDGHSAFLHLQRTLGVQTRTFIASYAIPGLDKVYHVQTANNYHERLKTWIQRQLRGVSTKYLPNYLAWMRLSSWTTDGVSPQNIIASAMGKQIINL